MAGKMDGLIELFQSKKYNELEKSLDVCTYKKQRIRWYACLTLYPVGELGNFCL